MAHKTRSSSFRIRSNSVYDRNNNSVADANQTTNVRARHKSGGASYADLITRAILNSQEKRLALSEIYDWFVENVPGLKDQRYLHSAKGWKNAVRHTLSINPRFRKMARLGRPGWWTVDGEYHRPQTVVPPTAQAISPSGRRATALVWDIRPNPEPPESIDAKAACQFRNRLASAPALVVSQLLSCPSSVASMSRPPSSTSISCMSTPMGSPQAFSPPSAQDTQTVQIWQDNTGLSFVAVPRPLPMRVANVSEMATQTDSDTHIRLSEPIPNMISGCNYFESISPAVTPVMDIGTFVLEEQRRQQQTRCPQSPIDSPQLLLYPKIEPDQTEDIRLTLSKYGDGSHFLLVTNNTGNGLKIGKNEPGAGIPAILQRCMGVRLPDDLQTVKVDPSVQCDVQAVLQYEKSVNGQC